MDLTIRKVRQQDNVRTADVDKSRHIFANRTNVLQDLTIVKSSPDPEFKKCNHIFADRQPYHYVPEWS